MTKPHYRLRADGTAIKVSDGLQNLTANLGTGRDKAAWGTYGLPLIDDATLLNAYRGSWVARKIVDIPALDATRNWRAWQAQADVIEDIEREEMRLGLRLKVKQAITAARLFGGAAILIGTNDADLSKPLDPARIKAGGLRYLTVLQKRHLSGQMIETDPASDYYGKPRLWHLSTGAASVTVHASRLAVFNGNGVVDDAIVAIEAGWSDSVLLSAFEAVRNLDATVANVSSLIYEAKVDTIGIPDMMAMLQSPGDEALLLRRLTLAETAKGINGTLVHDAAEIIGQKTASFSSLPEILDRMMVLASGAADIPMTRFMGQSPAGMSSTGESDLRNYYDRLRAMQELDVGPSLHTLDECLIRSATGDRAEEIHYIWASLWQVSDKERADIGKLAADTVVALRNTGLIPDEALSEALVNMMTENGAMPGLESAMKDYLAEAPNEGDDLDAAGAAPEAMEGDE